MKNNKTLYIDKIFNSLRNKEDVKFLMSLFGDRDVRKNTNLILFMSLKKQ